MTQLRLTLMITCVMEYVTRWETYDRGNGYVGVSASEDTEFIDGIYN